MRTRALPWLLALLGAAPALAKPIPVVLEKTEVGWRLLRGGEPFRVRGAGGDGSLALLRAAGANATRTWGADDLGGLLDEAQRQGLAVTVGLWLGHERHGFKYTSADLVAEQYEKVREAVLRYRDHPAVLLWGIGNEMEGFEAGDNAAIWSAVNNLAALVKKLDPNHPTMTVTAEIGGDRVKNVHRLCPDIDIMGINSYGGVQSLPQRYRAAGGTKPYLVTETGPPGAWETGKTSWGAPIEPTSTEKATFYTRAYAALEADAGLNLGAHVFLWSHKRESTATWFGMFLRDGRRTAAVDAMTRAWGGEPVKNAVPQLLQLGVKGPDQVSPGAVVEAFALAQDPERDPLQYTWRLEPEGEELLTGGDTQPEPEPIRDAIARNGGKTAKVQLPTAPGTYRLYLTVADPGGGAAAGNVPLRVLGEVDRRAAPRATLPIVILGEGATGSPYVPSGFMGQTKAIALDPLSKSRPKVGETCLEVTYAEPGGWGGVVWQDPPNDWGDRPGGRDWTGARTLSFWVRGAEGGERVKFGYGLLGADKTFSDSAHDERDGVELSREWQQLRFDLGGKDLRRIKTAFFWVAAGRGRPLRFYLDEIRVD